MTDLLEMRPPDWLAVSGETMDRLVGFAALIRKWNPAINLVSKASLPQLWQRHIFDSAQLVALAPAAARSWVDLGSGGGFPGLIVAILAQAVLPDLRVTLVEADQRKATFLAEASRHAGLTTVVLAQRIETLSPLNADVLSARALAPLAQMCGHAVRHLAKGGVALYPKGAQATAELALARRDWRFQVTEHSSKTDPDATILAVSEVSHV